MSGHVRQWESGAVDKGSGSSQPATHGLIMDRPGIYIYIISLVCIAVSAVLIAAVFGDIANSEDSASDSEDPADTEVQS